jgi:hypothetical protein
VKAKSVNYLKEVEIDRMSKLEKKDREIWQVLLRKLRVWSASSEGASEGDDAIPVRPWMCFISNLYPLGRMINRSLSKKSEVPHSPREILDLLITCMLEPADESPRHRPDKIVIEDPELASDLITSLTSIGIECTVLSAGKKRTSLSLPITHNSRTFSLSFITILLIPLVCLLYS